MTESEWLDSTDPDKMLAFLRDRVSDRKLRLFALASFRQFRFLLVPETLDSLTVAERFTEGLATSDERKHARERAFQAVLCPDPSTAHRRGPAKACVAWVLARRAYDAATRVAQLARQIGTMSYQNLQSDALEKTECGWKTADWTGGIREQVLLQVAILRDIFGNPFRPITFDSRRRTSDVLNQAQSIYDEHAFTRLPALADAFASFGCDNEELLAHCRNGKPHFRGCWVVDHVLRKS